MKIDLEISEGLYGALKDYLYEIEYDTSGKNMNDFIIDAIVEKVNKENTMFEGEIDKNGWTNKKSSTENFIGI